ncbi:MAG: DUF445 domain-containing protein [Acidimicrobiales bacterium]
MPSVQATPASLLRRMKATAAAFLAVAAAVFVVTTVWLPSSEVRGFLQAGSEAAMIGGLADWFAVTALFRRPLGLPIPHTALVPRKKDELATKLGEFVTGYFLTPEALEQQVVETGVVARVGSWLADPERAGHLAADLASAVAAAIGAADTVAVEDYVIELLRRDHARRSYAPVLGRLLARAVGGGAQRPLVDLLAQRTREYLAAHQAALHPTVRRFIEESHWVAALVTTDRVVNRLFRDTLVELERIEHEPDHPVRVALEDLLRRLAFDLRHDPDAADRVDALVGRLLDDPQAQAALRDAVGDAVESVRLSLGDPGSTLTARIADMVAHVGKRAATEPEFHDAVEGWVRGVVTWTVRRYGGEVTALIRRQVEAWPAAAASRRIELAVGRDLQYIRLNGTVVGALAGVAIHAVGLALP